MDSLMTDGMAETIKVLTEQYESLLPAEADRLLICRDCYHVKEDCLCRLLDPTAPRPAYWPIWHVIQYLRLYNSQKG